MANMKPGSRNWRAKTQKLETGQLIWLNDLALGSSESVLKEELVQDEFEWSTSFNASTTQCGMHSQ